MQKFVTFFYISLILSIFSCTNAQTQTSKTNLTATEFENEIKQTPNAPIIDVRTPSEFEKGHIQNAKNIDINSGDFQSQISIFDKSNPIFVYCLSGGRSASAANLMRQNGFTNVIELNGGMMAWRAANLPESKDNNIAPSNGLSQSQFDSIINSDKLVLVDFYADWCQPCKKMKPYLEEISKDMIDKVVVVRINADENTQLCKDLNIDALPVLQLYKNKTLTWNNKGYISKKDVLKKLN